MNTFKLLKENRKVGKALEKKPEASGISVTTLRKVFNRGKVAWKSGHRPGTTPEQWGYARVNAFIVKKKKGNLDHDKDLAEERGVELQEDISTMSSSKLKWHFTTKMPHGRYSQQEIKDEHKRRRQSEPNFHTVKRARDA